jgi:hypothetical protein
LFVSVLCFFFMQQVRRLPLGSVLPLGPQRIWQFADPTHRHARRPIAWTKASRRHVTRQRTGEQSVVTPCGR